jgi:hypothetical protein
MEKIVSFLGFDVMHIRQSVLWPAFGLLSAINLAGTPAFADGSSASQKPATVIHVSSGLDQVESCTYVIIGQRHLLTAGHCTESLKSGMIFRSRSTDGQSSASHKVENVIRHPQYIPGWDTNTGYDINKKIELMQFDIAVVRLTDPIVEYPIQPLPLAQIDEGSDVAFATEAVNVNDIVSERQHMTTSFSSYAYRKKDGTVVRPGLFLVEIENAQRGFCHSDSGGGIIVSEKGNRVLLAILSSMIDDPKKKCADKTRSILAVPVIDNLKWILPEITGKNA